MNVEYLVMDQVDVVPPLTASPPRSHYDRDDTDHDSDSTYPTDPHHSQDSRSLSHHHNSLYPSYDHHHQHQHHSLPPPRTQPAYNAYAYHPPAAYPHNQYYHAGHGMSNGNGAGGAGDGAGQGGNGSGVPNSQSGGYPMPVKVEYFNPSAELQPGGYAQYLTDAIALPADNLLAYHAAPSPLDSSASSSPTSSPPSGPNTRGPHYLPPLVAPPQVPSNDRYPQQHRHQQQVLSSVSPSSSPERRPAPYARPQSHPRSGPHALHVHPQQGQPPSHLAQSPAPLSASMSVPSPLTPHSVPLPAVLYDADTFKASLSGTRFEEKEDAIDYIKEEASQCGFSVLVRTSKPDYVVVICNCGRRLKTLKGERKRNRKFKTAMTGCEWRVVLFRSGNRVWEFRTNTGMLHNHTLPVSHIYPDYEG
ncbi:hypothetical protein BDK51DRAFT_40864 [Blyttiomyces helicus]|uniref:FAR1 domain-containing protein n=1 Tax=Blyttiomyces helicus TaxID=388810 RepID=A0A4P9W757_9FUNG|nr:hypothetical protein BDK51DRAFT_40864 [Blyttiomyces helicus]|eukprot:RKO86590.1 hypothetical protein BDK51DRAFT_40864 [Blyttiomyces helicus]